MSEKKDPCTCKSSLGHYLALVTGTIRLLSVILGIVFSGELAKSPDPWIEFRRYYDKLMEIVESVVSP